METHGGVGVLFNRCYRGFEHGVVFEKDRDKVRRLASQRPTWSVYETDCVIGISNGIGEHLAVNYFDLDPWGSPWDTIAAIFDRWKYFPSKFAMAITDGQRRIAKINSAWHVEQLRPFVACYGNEQIYENYVEICAEHLTSRAASRGYAITKWTGYYCGYAKQMTHFGAVLERELVS